jgi:two-component system, chemotaxis family, sensor kinase CheA
VPVATDQEAKLRRRLATFRTVAGERLDRLNLGWIELEQGSAAPGAGTVFLREIHTLKGEAGLTGFGSINRLLHKLEDLVQPPIKAGVTPDPSVGDLLMRGLEVVSKVLKRDPETESPEVIAFLAELPKPEGKGDKRDSGPLNRPAPEFEDEGPRQPVKAPPPPVARASEPPPPPARPAAAPATPPAPSPAAPVAPTGPTVVTAAPAAATAEPARRMRDGVRLTSEKLDGLRDLVAELLLTRVRLERSAVELRNARETALDLRREARNTVADSTLRLISQLAEALTGLESRLRDEGHQVSRLVNQLDGSTRELRMVPLASLLERFPVALRTLARRLGKQVQLRTEGEATEVDREVLERLEEPLLHLLQNAVDHGIESPEGRRATGKSAEATITLRSWLAGQTLHVEVKDDGAGIDAQRVRARALSLKLIDPVTAQQLGDEAIIHTIFSAGFSTRTEVSEVSGRGIGLNVVSSAVEGLGGAVKVTTELGRGTTFHVEVPVTVAITAVVLFRSGTSRYGIPASAVETIADQDENAMIDSVDGTAFRHGDRVIPLLSLETLLGEPSIEANADRGGRVIIVRSGADRVAFRGSYEHAEREVVLKPTGKFFERQRLVTAAVHLEDGSLALVLKPAELVFAARGTRTGEAAAPSDIVTPRTGFGKTILVADDSPVVRDLIADALRAHGIRVIEASDGEEALQRLTNHPNIDLVVTDFEMPRLDGVGMIRALRARQGVRRIPAVVVSMRGSDADKRMALDAGADAYLVKSDFSHAGLWTMIARFLG